MATKDLEPENTAADACTQIHDALHDLAQPLTSLLFVVEMAAIRNSAEEMQEALATARVECRRAVNAMEKMRAAVAALESGDEA